MKQKVRERINNKWVVTSAATDPKTGKLVETSRRVFSLEQKVESRTYFKNLKY